MSTRDVRKRLGKAFLDPQPSAAFWGMSMLAITVVITVSGGVIAALPFIGFGFYLMGISCGPVCFMMGTMMFSVLIAAFVFMPSLWPAALGFGYLKIALWLSLFRPTPWIKRMKRSGT
jgi:hypothetical protein